MKLIMGSKSSSSKQASSKHLATRKRENEKSFSAAA